ncbi:hypothetical protein WM40_01320 [Robbsia andropogonis]|uniref:Uncharacterized protein n=1 Tax=Robbsia andropogonis TaxID=28092 RepID=A0A0F5K578_9BURK|nr:hypothetical protein WM40_01320 [Robbsia andropogonis]
MSAGCAARRARGIRLLLEAGDTVLELLQALTRPRQYLRLRVEILARDNVKFREALGKDCLYIALDIFRRGLPQQVSNPLLRIFQKSFGFHIYPCMHFIGAGGGVWRKSTNKVRTKMDKERGILRAYHSQSR